MCKKEREAVWKFDGAMRLESRSDCHHVSSDILAMRSHADDARCDAGRDAPRNLRLVSD